MGEYNFHIFLTFWPLFAVGYGGGIIYGLRFLRKNELIDTRTPQFIGDQIFGRLGANYKIFYKAHCEKHGKFATRVLLVLHLLSTVMVFAFPIFLA